MKTAIYPGTFDPITYGHLDLLERSLPLFEEIVVAFVKHNPNKKRLFTAEERLDMIVECTKHLSNVRVEIFDGLLVDYAKNIGSEVIIRGLRAVSDFEYEFQLALMNRRLSKDIKTVFMMPHEKYTYLNSTIVKEVARLGGDISAFVPDNVALKLKEKYNT